MVVVGITGLNGAGKTQVVDFFKKHGFKHYSFRNYIVKELNKRNMAVNRDNMRFIANIIRLKNGSGYIADQIYSNATGDKIVMESIRTVGEIETLKKYGDFILLAVVGNQKIRYDRIKSRASETDNVTFEKFVEQELKEMKNADPHKQNLFGCIKKADYKIVNDGSLDDLKKKLDVVLKHIK